jgi:hypothetical protein
MSNATTWTFDIADGVLKNRALSSKLLYQSARHFKIAGFSKQLDGFSRKMGQTYTLPDRCSAAVTHLTVKNTFAPKIDIVLL